jgi:hypothetical protein
LAAAARSAAPGLTASDDADTTLGARLVFKVAIEALIISSSIVGASYPLRRVLPMIHLTDKFVSNE